MKTRYKISLIIASSAIIYILFHSVLLNLCNVVIDDVEHVCFVFWLQDTSIHISNHNWDTGDGIGSWSGTAEGMEQGSIFYDDLKNNSGFIFWHMILPTFAILLIYQRDRSKK
ncbi:hypothetical protein [Nitrosopumilus sp.]|uniref:hypothetical protein n=1 Tax=Nitrosopumilus sp. TaxID=2024843 RepID=UPI003B5C389A